MKLNEKFKINWEDYELPKDYNPEYSGRYKRKINRLFREQVGFKEAYYPEVDNLIERTRSKIIYTLLKHKK